MPKYARLPDETWDEIKRRWSTGVSEVQLAADFDTSRASIYNRRTAEGWKRALKAQVKQAVGDKVVQEVAGKVAIVATATDPHVMDGDSLAVEAAATAIVNVMREHRLQVRRGRAIADVLFGQLEEAVANRQAIEEAIELETAQDKTGVRREQMLRAVSLPAHISALKDLGTALSKFIPLERQALGMDDKEDDGVQVTFNLDMTGRSREEKVVGAS
jgi:hypothetical protein